MNAELEREADRLLCGAGKEREYPWRTERSMQRLRRNEAPLHAAEGRETGAGEETDRVRARERVDLACRKAGVSMAQRASLFLGYWGLSLEEIGCVLGISVGSVKRHREAAEQLLAAVAAPETPVRVRRSRVRRRRRVRPAS